MEKRKPSSNSSQPNEIGIIELLNYFKDILKSIFNYIKKFFLGVWNIIVNLLLLIRNNWIFVGTSILVFLGLYFILTTQPKFKKYSYEMIVEPNYETANALEERINSLNFRQGSSDYKITEKLYKISMTPIENYQDVVNDYFYSTSGEYDDNVAYKTKFPNDTVFFRQVTLENYQKQLQPNDYSRFRIRIKSGQPLEEKDILLAVTEPFNTDPGYTKVKRAFLSELESEIKSNNRSLEVLDTVLIQRSKATVNAEQDIVVDGPAQRVPEREMMQEKRDILKDNYSLKMRWIKNQNVINIISKPLLVATKTKLVRNPIYFAFYGFCFALIILLLRRFNSYLKKRDQATS